MTNNNIEFKAVFYTILDNLPERSQEIVAKRFGIGEKKPMTLQAIGDEYGITRERVRQIVNSGLKNVNKSGEHEDVVNAKEIIINHIKTNKEIILLEEVVTLGNDSDDGGAILFLIEGMSEVNFVNTKKYPVNEQVVALTDFDMNEWINVHESTKTILEDKQKTYTCDRLHEKINNEDVGDGQSLNKYLTVSSEIGKNPFDKWGLYEWDEISPRGVREKALLILKEEDKPMHFKEIAQAIDDYGMNKNGKKSHPQTVHNELIRDDNFVLVGRGVYAIDTGNYSKGTVKDVVKNILENSKESLTLEDVVERVLKTRQVKPSTIKVNLNIVAKKMNEKYTLDTNAS